MKSARKIAYQGVPGAFSERVARHFGGAMHPMPCLTFEEVFAVLSSGCADYAVVPYENSLVGSIEPVNRLLEREAVTVLDRLVLPIRHALIGICGAKPADIRRVYSHPVALAQCRNLFERHPRWEALKVADTAGAASYVVRDGRREQAAIASRRAAELYGASVLADGVEDSPDNCTHFVLIERSRAGAPV